MSRTQSRQQVITPTGSERPDLPQQFSFAIPAYFSAGQTSGNMTCVDAYTCQITLSPPLILARAMECHLTQASCPYSQPNVGYAAAAIPGYSAGNNRISISWAGGSRTDYFVPTGLYSVSDVELALNQIAVTAGWITSTTTPLFILQGISATQKVLFTVQPTYLTGAVFPAGGVIIDWLNPSVASINDSLGPILGFPTTGGPATITLTGGSGAAVTTAAPNVADFTRTTAYLIYMSILTDTYLSGQVGKLLTQFSLGGHTPNDVFAVEPSLKTSANIAPGTYSVLSVYLTDQSGNRLSLANFSAPLAVTTMIANVAADGSV